MKWVVVGKYEFDFRDQQPEIYTRDPSLFEQQNFVVQCNLT